jgi:hypothetical protein
MSQRDQLLRAVQAAGTGRQQAAAVAALDAFDQRRRAQIRESRATDLSATAVRRTLQPVPVHEHHTAATDWLGDIRIEANYRTDMIAQASQWYRRLPREVAADREEFLEQARGFAYTAASRYGDQALAARRTFLEYVGYLCRDAASGLPQIDQTVDPNNQESATPYPTEVFDNFAPEQNAYNGGVEGPDHQSQISSEQAPLLQQVQQQDGAGSGFGSGPEKPDEHSTGFDTSNSYAEVPLGPPGVIPTAPGPMPQGQSQPNPVAGTDQVAGNVPPMRAASMRHAAYTGPDQDGFRWRISSASDEAGGGDVDPMAAPYHTRCGSTHWPEQACGHAGEHTASVAVGYLMNSEDFARIAYFEAQGATEGVGVLRAAGRDLSRVAAHHDALTAAFRREARGEDEIAWLHGYMSRVRPVLAAGGATCACGAAVKAGKTQCKNCRQAGKAKTGGRLDFFRAAEAASRLPQVQETVSPDNVPDPQADQLPPDTMFPIDPAFAQQWETGPGGAQPKSRQAALASILMRPRATWSAGQLQFVADFMSAPHQSTDDLNAPYNSAQTTPPAQGSGDYQTGLSEGQADRAGGHAPTFSDNSSGVSDYVRGYSAGFGGGTAAAGTPDVPGSMGGDAGQLANSQEAQRSFEVSKGAARRQAGTHSAPGTTDRCPECGVMHGNKHKPGCEHRGEGTRGKGSDDWAFESSLKKLRVSAAFVTREAIAEPDFRKGYGFAQHWVRGQKLAAQGSPAFEAGLYAGITDRPQVQAAWISSHHAQAGKHPVLRQRMASHASFSLKVAKQAGFAMCGNRHYPLRLTAATTTDLITDGPGTSPDPMGSTPLNGPGTAPPMGGGEDPARAGGAPPYQQMEPAGHGPVAPDDIMGQPQQAPQQAGPFTQTFSGRHPENADLSPVAPNTAAQPGYENTDAYQGDPRQQRAMAFRRKVQASLAGR